jgi:hypothetical protein
MGAMPGCYSIAQRASPTVGRMMIVAAREEGGVTAAPI